MAMNEVKNAFLQYSIRKHVNCDDDSKANIDLSIVVAI